MPKDQARIQECIKCGYTFTSYHIQQKCNECQNQLTAWFEVDHVQRLEHGGSNEVSNLVALCRECHGEKTAMENM